MIVLRTEQDETESTLEFLKDLRETMDRDIFTAKDLVDRAIWFLTKKLGRDGADGKCPKCQENEAMSELHSCPYNSDVNNDDSAYCNCCQDCSYECAMDI
jgi:hypothetical protein